MFDLIRRTNWDQLYSYFARGEPALVLQLLALNTIFFLMFAYRRMRRKKPLRPTTASTIQTVLLAANIFIVLRDTITQSVSWLI
jgi:hypothetical protein